MHEGNGFSAKTLGKSLFDCQNDWSGQLWSSRAVLTFGKCPDCGGLAGSGFSSDDEVDICGGFNHPAVVAQPFFISNCLPYLLKKLMFLEIVFTSQCKAVVRSQNVKITKA